MGRGLCTEADLGHGPALNVGERSISLKMAMRLDVELRRGALYGDDRGLDVSAWWSGGMMIRSEGRLRTFWASLQRVSEYMVTTSKHPAAARCMLCSQSPSSCIARHVDAHHCQFIALLLPIPLLLWRHWARCPWTRWATVHLFCSTALHWNAVSTKKTASWNSW